MKTTTTTTSRRTRKVSRAFAPEQENYMLAKAAYDLAFEAYQAECKARGAVFVRNMTDEAFERVNDLTEEIRAKHNLDALSTARIKAEKTLVEWSLAKAQPHATEAQRADIEAIRKRAHLHPKVWTELLDLALRVAF